MHQQTDQIARILSPVDALHQSFAIACAESFSTYTGTPFRAVPLPSTTAPYRDHLLTLANPTFLLVFTSNLFQGQLTLEIHPALAYLILEQLLGGTDPDAFIPKRRFTEIESRLVLPIASLLLDDLAKVWPPPPSSLRRSVASSLSSPSFTLVRLEHNPRSTRIVPDDEEVLILPIEFCLAAFTPQHQHLAVNSIPRLTLCMPDPAVATLGIDPSSPNGATACQTVDRNTPLEFRAILAETTLMAEDLTSLQVGDVLTTDRPANSRLTLVPTDPKIAERLRERKSGKTSLEGHLVKLRGQKALYIARSPAPEH